MTYEEVVDIVDQDNVVLYQASKGEAHVNGLLHRTVIANVRDSQGHWTLVKQASDRQDAGQYVSPVGGHVRAGETEIAALKREALEEIGIEDFEFRFVSKAIYRRNVIGRDENHYFIMYEILTDQALKLGAEAVDTQKFTAAELKQELATDPTKFGAAFYFALREFYPDFLTKVS